MSSRTTNIIIDGHALLYKYFFAYNDEPVGDIVSMAHANILYKMQYLDHEYSPTNIIIVFDCKNSSWRKIYTNHNNKEKITHRLYKGGRHEKMSLSEKEKLDEFQDRADKFITFFRTQTTVPCIQADYLEGDDIIAGYVQRFYKDNHIIYGADKDFLQLIDSISGDVRVIESHKDTERTLEDWCDDPELFLFEKLFRGEGRAKDNVQSAYPRLFRKKILEAYNDDYLFNNLKNHTFEVTELAYDDTPITYTYKTGDLLEENKLLMDLTAQPEYIKDMINDAITDGITSTGKFDYISFLRFCKRNGMQHAMDNKDRFVKIISRKFTYPSYDGSSGV